ncbi:MAG: hypothetical protein VW405_02900 [Rhodospirillaceae bacterium]
MDAKKSAGAIRALGLKEDTLQSGGVEVEVTLRPLGPLDWQELPEKFPDVVGPQGPDEPVQEYVKRFLTEVGEHSAKHRAVVREVCKMGLAAPAIFEGPAAECPDDMIRFEDLCPAGLDVDAYRKISDHSWEWIAATYSFRGSGDEGTGGGAGSGASADGEGSKTAGAGSAKVSGKAKRPSAATNGG